MMMLLKCAMVDRACTELTHNLIQQSDWVTVPIEGLLRMVRAESAS